MRNHNPYFIVFTLLLETMFIGIISVIISTSRDINDLRVFTPFAHIMVFLLTISAIISINQTLKNTKKEMESRLIKIHLKQMEDMVDALHLYHQEYTGHLQTLQAMIYLDDYGQARDYIDGITHKLSPLVGIAGDDKLSIASLLYGKQKVAEVKGIQFDIAIKCSLECIDVPASDLNAIIGNLLDNALEACMRRDADRRMALEIKYEDGHLNIYVNNNGPEISEQELSRIFTPGYSTASLAGRGFGLYQVHKLVASHNGKIEVITHPKTTFIITLPGGYISGDKKCGIISRSTDGQAIEIK